MLLFSNLFSFLSPLHCDTAYPWQIGFQDGSTPNFEGIVELHDTIFFYLVVISFLVFWMLAVIMIKFSSSKVGIVHKYHNHGIERLTPYSGQRPFIPRFYSTCPIYNSLPLSYVTDQYEPTDTKEIPFKETRQITASRLVLAKMLTYLSSINSPLFSFLTDHPRVQNLTSTDPYPTISAFCKGLTLAAYFSTAVLSVMNPAILPYSTVYAIGHPDSKDYYIGSRVAGSNRATGHRQDLRQNSRKNGSLTILQQFIVSLGGYNNAVWGTLVKIPSLSSEFRYMSPLYKLNANEMFILRYFDQWMIRIHEQAIISFLNPTLNTDNVKFQLDWSPVNIIDAITPSMITAFIPGTSIEVASHVFKMQFAVQLGIKYNTFIKHLNSIRPVWSPALNMFVTLLEEGAEYTSTAIQGPYLNTQSIVGVDLNNLPNGIIALAVDKITQLAIFKSAAQAAHLLDNKVDFMYISRYINIEQLVSTSLGLVYFVMNPNYIAPTTQFKGSIKGVKAAIYMYDPIWSVYVMFISKAEASSFIWGAKNRTQAFDRYLARPEGKAPLAFKGQLLFYHLKDLPADVKTITMSEYYTLINGNRYIHPRDLP